jgi:signal transduction histidine kinase
LVENLVAHLREEAAETAIEFSRSAERAHVWGDAVLVRHAIENVLRNGVQYSPTNDVVSVLIDVQQSQVRIGVQDTGPGIPAEEIARVREPYFRGAASRGTSGTGLGLYFVDRIVKGHGGALYIDSKAGRGASVTIELPLSKTPAPP